MDPEAIPNFLADQRDQAPDELQYIFISIEDLWERKLWHQLTDTLIDYFRQDASAHQRLPIYNTFILSFAEKINQLKLVSLALSASTQCKDDQERRNFLTQLADKINKPASQDAYVYALVEVASVKLRLSDIFGSRKDLDTAESILDSFDSVETVVHAAFYRVNADYYQVQESFASYYRNALLYLACIELESLSSESRSVLAYNLAISALVSDSIYNFGELLLHPILDSLKPPHSNSWLRDLLFAFNRGDLVAYDVLSDNVGRDPLLASHKQFLYQKISLAALTETVFKRPPHDRAMTFTTISQETKVRPSEIEHLIMKALSLGLLRGTIDQVAEVAKINWVQPKVLERSQIEGMRTRLKDWDSSVNSLGHWIEGVGKDVWAA